MSSAFRPDASRASVSWGRNALLASSLLIALVFTFAFALPYFFGAGSGTDRYAESGRLGWLLAHIGTGIIALVIGPFQLWMGFNRTSMSTHRLLGMVYVSAIAISSITTYYLAITTTVNWVFGAGLAGLATAWVISTGLAFLAIRRRNFEQHKEWMIRSYVVTFGFIFFRMFVGATQAASVGPLSESLIAASWFCWSVPLLITESILQGRKILSRPAR